MDQLKDGNGVPTLSPCPFIRRLVTVLETGDVTSELATEFVRNSLTSTRNGCSGFGASPGAAVVTLFF